MKALLYVLLTILTMSSSLKIGLRKSSTARTCHEIGVLENGSKYEGEIRRASNYVKNDEYLTYKDAHAKEKNKGGTPYGIGILYKQFDSSVPIPQNSCRVGVWKKERVFGTNQHSDWEPTDFFWKNNLERTGTLIYDENNKPKFCCY